MEIIKGFIYFQKLNPPQKTDTIKTSKNQSTKTNEGRKCQESRSGIRF